jgi:hypothetical protein
MIETWLPAIMRDKERKLLWAASEIIDSKQVPLCPLCNDQPLRFYYREFGIVKLPRRRGTIWVWCEHCRLWEHISGVEPGKDFEYENPLTAIEFKEIDTPLLIPKLNELWDQGKLPKTLKSE